MAHKPHFIRFLANILIKESKMDDFGHGQKSGVKLALPISGRVFFVTRLTAALQPPSGLRLK